MSLTSADEGVDVFNLSDGRVIAVSDQGLYSVEQAVDVDDGAGVADAVLKLPQPLKPVLVRLAL